MKKLITLIIASLMLLLPLSADDDIIPLGVEDSEDISLEDMTDEEFYAYCENVADEMGITVDELFKMLDEMDESEDGDVSVATTGSIDEVEDDLSAMRLYKNDATGYEVLIEDNANLLSDKERDNLLNDMIPITQWGNALFHTTNNNFGYSTSDLAATLYEDLYGRDTSGTIFLVDMDERMLWIHSEGDVYKVINSNYAQSITDNVYKFASNEDYYGCANKVFTQIETLLEGGKIAQPMKHISNYLLALILALIICYLYMKSNGKTADDKAQAKPAPIFHGTIDGIAVTKGKLTSVVMSSSSGGGGSRGGGGGHSGGGGGHRF